MVMCWKWLMEALLLFFLACGRKESCVATGSFATVDGKC